MSDSVPKENTQVFSRSFLKPMGYPSFESNYQLQTDFDAYLRENSNKFRAIGYRGFIENNSEYAELHIANLDSTTLDEFTNFLYSFEQYKIKSTKKNSCTSCQGTGERVGGWMVPGMMHKCTDCNGTGTI